MKPSEMRKKSPAELKDELIKLRREQFNLRMAAAAGQPARPDQYGKVRRNVARVKTVLNELERAKSAGSKG
jgi:large subunit ribosomal protein L29